MNTFFILRRPFLPLFQHTLAPSFFSYTFDTYTIYIYYTDAPVIDYIWGDTIL